MVKAVFEDKYGVNCKFITLYMVCRKWIHLFVYFSYCFILMHFAFLSWNIILLRILRFHTGMWVEFGCYHQIGYHISLLRTLKSKTLCLELNETKVTLRNLIF